VAEAEALDERLVGFIVHLRQELQAGRFVTGAKAFLVAQGSTGSHCHRPEPTGEAQPASRRRQNEACLAPLAGVLDERRGSMEGRHRLARLTANVPELAGTHGRFIT
jgi:hypothetical protein